ncbi:head fiber protein [Atlantibacter hermannii]|uniref:head fiber protein n=1 Tax=Atlantibacter hermannii TaxID=565 RepID=UPI0028ABBE6C|nr:head fiber protein [Atlantibacter hermannii]MCQ4969162.1 head fiber protein [Enterobacteriaceae bacterium DFI.7.85]
MSKRAMSTGGYPFDVTTPDDPVVVPAATTATIGGVKKMTNQANTTATDVAGLVTDFNALLTKLKAAGMM